MHEPFPSVFNKTDGLLFVSSLQNILSDYDYHRDFIADTPLRKCTLIQGKFQHMPQAVFRLCSHKVALYANHDFRMNRTLTIFFEVQSNKQSICQIKLPGLVE